MKDHVDPSGWVIRWSCKLELESMVSDGTLGGPTAELDQSSEEGREVRKKLLNRDLIE